MLRFNIMLNPINKKKQVIANFPATDFTGNIEFTDADMEVLMQVYMFHSHSIPVFALTDREESILSSFNKLKPQNKETVKVLIERLLLHQSDDGRKN